MCLISILDSLFFPCHLILWLKCFLIDDAKHLLLVDASLGFQAYVLFFGLELYFSVLKTFSGSKLRGLSVVFRMESDLVVFKACIS